MRSDCTLIHNFKHKENGPHGNFELPKSILPAGLPSQIYAHNLKSLDKSLPHEAISEEIRHLENLCRPHRCVILVTYLPFRIPNTISQLNPHRLNAAAIQQDQQYSHRRQIRPHWLLDSA